jgi:hypothetical protein
LRKFYPWYAERLRVAKHETQPLVSAPTTAYAREALSAIVHREPALAA